MANSYNSMPIKIDTVMTQGWRALQTLNQGNLPSVAQNPANVNRQWGFRCLAIQWTGIGSVGDKFTVIDPNDSTILFQGQAGSTTADQYYPFPNPPAWRDFKVSVLGSGTLLIAYRA